jgi:hypothetical protein
MLSARRALPRARLVSSKKSIHQGGQTVPNLCSIFSQLLQLFPRLEFEQAVKKHRSDYAIKGFKSWGQFVAMLFSQFGRAHSLRKICGGLASCEGKLKHLGVSDSAKRSTFAYANANRPWSLHQTVFEQLLAMCQSSTAGLRTRKKFRFKNKLVSLDASVIDLSLSLFDWAQFRRTKGAVKLFFKAIKQNLKIKTFLETNANAVKTQIWTALIAMLVLRYLQLMSTFGWSLSNLSALLRHQLFVYRDLFAWLNAPFEGHPQLAEGGQVQLSLGLAS